MSGKMSPSQQVWWTAVELEVDLRPYPWSNIFSQETKTILELNKLVRIIPTWAVESSIMLALISLLGRVGKNKKSPMNKSKLCLWICSRFVIPHRDNRRHQRDWHENDVKLPGKKWSEMMRWTEMMGRELIDRSIRST